MEIRRRWLFCIFVALPICSSWAGSCSDSIILGESGGLAVDQPRVSFEVIDSSTNSLGPSFSNEALLDTGAERILIVGAAASELESNGIVTEGELLEQGVSGFALLDVSAEYRFDYAGTDGIRQTLNPSRVLLNEDLNFGSFSGIVGMPAMVGKVVSMDYSVWSGGGIAFMEVYFTNGLPADPGSRYSFDVWPVEFPLPEGTEPPYADDEPLPFLDATICQGGRRASGDFVLDTGAQITIISLQMAIQAGMDTNNNGSVDDEAIDFLPVGGIGGTINAPLLLLDEFRLPTNEDVELVWTNASILVIDIHPLIDGVFGSDLLTTGWLDAFLGTGPDGVIRQVQMDFRNYPSQDGTIYLDLTPAFDVVLPGDNNDYDGDLVPDCWEMGYYASTNQPSIDTDGDGIPLFYEYAHGFDPTQPDPQPLQIEPRAGGGVQLEFWRSLHAPELEFVLQESPGLVPSEWKDVAAPETIATATAMREQVCVEVPEPPGQMHYRLQIFSAP